ncbi:DUF3541 domain-containing protein [Photobacterium sp. CCB-ST2H9]|uniref:DUF3541 domain-containing protein n=1 Tax=unclassified Photobacterium TaxID=2628852 RepID=UPI002003FF71|nr:DUF3541 domain-containing protein [Photobacterium sp. CCB-ST2H9]UTM58309.1 DUF3541 domain-containing protein [Photobacterium sp. CCB-ST2H9]
MKTVRSSIIYLLIALLSLPGWSAVQIYPQQNHAVVQQQVLPAYAEDAALIRHTFETRLYMLPAFKMGHYGLRMYRQTLDPKYKSAVWADMARVADRLNEVSEDIYTPAQVKAYSDAREARYSQKEGARSELRYLATRKYPEYYFLGVDLLGSMARANEYGLKHKSDHKLREILRRYDFARYATDPEMIRAWAAQLANQVYWLRQLGEQDVVEPFITAFRATYPDSKDKQLSEQQYMNKIYGMTHILFAASSYYQYQLRESDFQWIYDHFRHNIDHILLHTKEDVIAEVGISFLLAGLEKDPVVEKARKAIQKAIDRKAGMVPSVKGETELVDSEHRNTLAIMLLDWRGAHPAPVYQRQPGMFTNLPYGLMPGNQE